MVDKAVALAGQADVSRAFGVGRADADEALAAEVVEVTAGLVTVAVVAVAG